MMIEYKYCPILFADKGPSSQGYGFSSSHVRTWELDYKESWVPKNWCFWTVLLGKTLESPLDCEEIQPVNPKGNQPWILFGRTDAEVPILWPLDARADSSEKTLLLGKIEGRRRRGWQRMRWLDGITDSRTWNWANSRRWGPGLLQSTRLQKVRHNLGTEQQQVLFWKLQVLPSQLH